MRLYKNKWNKNKLNNVKVKEIADSTGLSFSACKVISSMGLSKREIDDFLSPSLSTELDNIKEAIDILYRHIESKSNILIFGDYDVDGISSSSLLYTFFKDNGVDTRVIIPNRYTHGYGLNEKSIDLVDDDVDLVITVDCGITSVAEVQALKEKGIDVIITDHHELKETLPNTVCVNPKIGGGYKYLAGAGVALKFAKCVARDLNFKFNDDLYILAMLGTIADVMPLKDENRYIVKKGLEHIKDSSFKGLNALISKLKLEKVDESDIGFKIAPIINAAGRLGEEDAALKLFVEFNDYSLIDYLISLNNKRKAEERAIVDEVLKKDYSNDLIVVDSSKEWKKGVLGIAAARVSTALKKPCILFNESETLSGSCRTFGDFDMLGALDDTSEYILKYGGHKQAAGLEVSLENYTEFKEKINEVAKKNIDKSALYNTYNYFDIELDDVSLDTVYDLVRLKPFGVGNRKPIFRLNGLKLLNFKVYGASSNFYVLNFEKNNVMLKAIYFKTNKHENFKVDYKYDIIFNLDVNAFNGNESVQLNLIDYRVLNKYFISHNPFLIEYYIDLANSIADYSKSNASLEFVYYENIVKHSGVKVEEFDYSKLRIPSSLPTVYIWKDIKYGLDRLEENIMNKIPDDRTLRKSYKYFLNNRNMDLNSFNNHLGLLLSLNIFRELGLLEYSIREESIEVEINENKKNVLLKDSATYNKMNKLLEDWNGFKKHD